MDFVDITELYKGSISLLGQYLHFKFLMFGYMVEVKDILLWSALASLIIAFLKEAINGS